MILVVFKLYVPFPYSNSWMEMHLRFPRINLSVMIIFIFNFVTKECKSLYPLILYFFSYFSAIAECGQNWFWSVLCEYTWSTITVIKTPFFPLSPWSCLHSLSQKLNFLDFSPITVVSWSLNDRSKHYWGATQRNISHCKEYIRESTEK